MSNTTYWNLKEAPLTESSFSEECKNLEETFARYKKNPNSLKKNLLLLIIIPLLILGLIFLMINYIPSVIQQYLALPIVLDMASLFGAVIYYLVITDTQKNLVNLLTAKANNWLYTPQETPNRWLSAGTSYPEIFKRGSQAQQILEEFWGTFGESTNFWIAEFDYVTGSGKSQVDHTDAVYAFRLNSPLTASFALIPRTIIQTLEHKLVGNELRTESVEFNTAFVIQYQGPIESVGAQIFEVLNPVALVHLLDFLKQFGMFTLLFREDIMLLSFADSPGNTHYTNFLRKVEVDERDVEAKTAQLNSVVTLAANLTLYLS